ncbi:hypothetical protein IWX50DRAFT_705814 [Phyllosticta citricarpa]|uniref:Uncharacterized protein n=1 Tax=Phyllosticta citricarpa TaxID=55181 RepID=A0ABR1LBF8_9PEZI
MGSTLNLLFLLENSRFSSHPICPMPTTRYRHLQNIYGSRSEQDSLHPVNPAEQNSATAAHLLPHKSPRRASTAAKTTTRNLLLLIHLSSFHFPQSSRPRSITNASYVHRAHQADITSSARTHALPSSNDRTNVTNKNYSTTPPRLRVCPRTHVANAGFFAGRRRGVVGCGAGHGPVAGRLRSDARTCVRTPPASPAPADGRPRGAGPDAAVSSEEWKVRGGGRRGHVHLPCPALPICHILITDGCEARFLRLFFASLWGKSRVARGWMDRWMDGERPRASRGDDDEENISR